MPEMIPDRLPREASVGEKKVFAALQGLPEDCIVYYEPVVGKRYPDFVVIMPSVGVLVIEAKGWYPAHIRSASTYDVEIENHGKIARNKHPIRQARDYMNALMNAAQRMPATATLLRASGEYAGRFIFPFGHMVVMNNCTRAQLDDRALSAVFPSSKVMARDELDGLASLSPEEVIDRLKSYFDPWWTYPPLAADQIDAFRVIIHPEVLVEAEPAQQAVQQQLFADQPQDERAALKALDLRQERSARGLGEGHRILYGVAGSGKTVILVARARLVAQDSSKRVLLLCYNRPLADQFRRSFADMRNVACHNFHKWGTAQGVPFDPDENEDAYGARLLAHLQSGGGEAGKYDAVFIDEAQDFALAWFGCAKAALKEPDDGDLLIVGDGTQALYKRRKFTWAEAGVNALGRRVNRRLDLDRNYRNTRPILQLAAGFAMNRVAAPQLAEEALPVFCPDPRTAIRDGPLPEIILSQDTASAVAGKVSQWVHAEGIKPSAIAVLYRARKKTVSDIAAALNARYPVNWRHAPASASHLLDLAGVNLSTIHAAKGLQWRAVIIVEADDMPLMFDSTPEASGSEPDSPEMLVEIERSLMYVALTRASERLAITCRTTTGFASELVRIIRDMSIRTQT